jgi:predicted DNA-binding WGR domain protein
MSYLVIQMECVIPNKNRKAFYHLVATKDLFSYKLTRRWGRIGSKGQPGHSERFTDQEAMAKGLRRIVRTRLAHGYVISSVDV